MHIESMNRPILALDDAHAAKRFLSAFIDCRKDCVGYELGFDGHEPVDQEWWSPSQGKLWTFSEFAYKVLSFDIELDGMLTDALCLTESETAAEKQLPMYRSLMNECAQAALRDGNNEIVEMTHQVQEMFRLWEEYLNFRKEAVARARA